MPTSSVDSPVEIEYLFHPDLLIPYRIRFGVLCVIAGARAGTTPLLDGEGEGVGLGIAHGIGNCQCNDKFPGSSKL